MEEVQNQRKKFRKCGVNFFLTFPQADIALTKNDVLKNVKNIFKDYYEWSVIALENHEVRDDISQYKKLEKNLELLEGHSGIHFHVQVHCNREIEFKGEEGLNQLDSITGKHGNYQCARNKQAVIRYVIKDGDYLQDEIDAKEYLKYGEKQKSYVYAEKLHKGLMTLEDINNECEGFVFNNKRKIDDYMNFLEDVKRPKKEYKKWFSLNCNSELAKILNKNCGNIKNRYFKMKQLWLYSDKTDQLKSSLIEELKKYFPYYDMPTDKEDKVSSGYNNKYDLIIFDGFNVPHKTVTFMENFVQGSEMNLRVLGGRECFKTNNPFVIVGSNKKIEELYTKSYRIIQSRFIEIEAFKEEIQDILDELRGYPWIDPELIYEYLEL